MRAREARTSDVDGGCTAHREVVPAAATGVSTAVLPSVASSVAAGRRFVSAVLDDLGLYAHRYEALLLTSELLTNSVLHGHGDPRLDVTWRHPEVEIAVTDGGTWAPRQSPVDHGATNGRGLQLLERLAARCGTRDSSQGTTIWFTLSMGAPVLPAPRASLDDWT
jgi:anti-sigma regulatory factor (Ser/Thr protein kinase)